jgi:hypothetical protein
MSLVFYKSADCNYTTELTRFDAKPSSGTSVTFSPGRYVYNDATLYTYCSSYKDGACAGLLKNSKAQNTSARIIFYYPDGGNYSAQCLNFNYTSNKYVAMANYIKDSTGEVCTKKNCTLLSVNAKTKPDVFEVSDTFKNIIYSPLVASNGDINVASAYRNNMTADQVCRAAAGNVTYVSNPKYLDKYSNVEFKVLLEGYPSTLLGYDYYDPFSGKLIGKATGSDFTGNNNWASIPLDPEAQLPRNGAFFWTKSAPPSPWDQGGLPQNCNDWKRVTAGSSGGVGKIYGNEIYPYDDDNTNSQGGYSCGSGQNGSNGQNAYFWCVSQPRLN